MVSEGNQHRRTGEVSKRSRQTLGKDSEGSPGMSGTGAKYRTHDTNRLLQDAVRQWALETDSFCCHGKEFWNPGKALSGGRNSSVLERRKIFVS